MRGISLAWRCTKFPFIPMALFSVALLLWWEKKPFFSALLSAQNGVLRVSPDIFLGSPMTSLTPGPNVDVHSHMPGVVWNSSLDNGEQREAGESNHNTSAKETLETGTKDTVGSYDLSTRSQQQIFTDYKSPAFASNDTLDNREDQAVDAESQNIFAKPPASASKKDNHEDQAVDVEAPNVPVYPLTTSNKVCNFAKGKWVTSENRPFYSGFECKRWLSAMWACRMTQRTDFAYEKFRWKPHDCELEEFDGAKFLRRMQDKTLALVGDSLGRQQFQSLMCMITGGKDRDDVEDVGKEFGLIKTGNAIRPDGWAYRFPITNTTIVFYWSSTLCDIEPIDPSNTSTEYAMHLDRPPAFLRKYFPRFDAVVLNTGHHWNRGKVNANKWVMYLNGQPNTDRRLSTIGNAKEFAVHSVIKWVDSQLTEHPKTKAFFRSISPRHFFNGDWNTGGTCDNTNPLSKSMEVLNEVPSDGLSSSAVKGTKVKLLDITGPSEVRDEGHISRYSIKGTPGVQDCLHWCLPGVPDTWNEILFAQL